jgi:NAD-dependent DNA ligase
MGWLRRLLGEEPQRAMTPPREPPVERRSIQFVGLDQQPPGAEVAVVGEFMRQDELARFTAPGVRIAHALLMPEPQNQHDHNAIAVYLSDEQLSASKVGYLSRENAIAYRPAVRAVAPRVLRVEARLTSEWHRPGEGTIGVLLHLGTPAQVLTEIIDAAEALGSVPIVPTANPWAGRIVVFTGASGFKLFGERLAREVQEVLAVRAGSKTHPRITKKVHLLVVGDVGHETQKLDTAEEYGIDIVAEADFWRALGYKLEPLWGSGR